MLGGDGLIDDLLCADMNLGPMRRAMAEKKEPQQPESTGAEQPMTTDKPEPIQSTATVPHHEPRCCASC